jgi:hypothetical protein
MHRPCLGAQRDDAPIAVIVLLDEMTEPFGTAQSFKVLPQFGRLELQRQLKTIGEFCSHSTDPRRFALCCRKQRVIATRGFDMRGNGIAIGDV